MGYTICSMCNKFFETDGNLRCPKCRDKYDKEYKVVKEYISTHAGASAIEVNANTGIAINTILKFLDEGLISSVEQNKSFTKPVVKHF